MYHSLLLHSPGETYLACFQFESIINRTIDTHMQLLCVCEHKVLWYQYKYLGIELLCHMISVCLTLQQISKMLSRVAETYCTLTKKIWGFLLLCIFTIAWYYQHFLKRSNSYGLFSHAGLFILFKFLATPCGIWDLGSLTKDQIHIPCIGRQSLNHGATREVPSR